MIILDEPANGLDPEGIRWIRDFLRHYATQGRSVLVSSHGLGEMSLLAQDLVVIGKGRLISQSTVDEFVRHHATAWVRVRSPQLPALIEALEQRGAKVERVDGADAIDVHDLAIEAGRRDRSGGADHAARAVDQDRVAGGRLPLRHRRLRRSTGREARS